MRKISFIKNFIIYLFAVIMFCLPTISCVTSPLPTEPKEPTKKDSFVLTCVVGFGLDDIVITATQNGEVVKPVNPKLLGYRFDGWFYSDDNGTTFGEEFEFLTKLTEDLSVYAKWTRLATRMITFVSGFGIADMKRPTTSKGTIIMPPDPKRLSNGFEIFKFDGWYYSDDDGTTLTQKFVNNELFPQTDINVYAKWTRKSASEGLIVPLLEPGMYSENQTLKFDIASGEQVFYTTDGSDPTKLAKSGNTYVNTASTKWYTNSGIPIYDRKNTSGRLQDLVDQYTCYESLTGNTYGGGNPENYNRGFVIKAVVMSADGTLSNVWTGSYFVMQDCDTLVDLPIMSIATDVDNLFGDSGIYRKYLDDSLSTIATIEYFDENKNQIFLRDGSLKIGGAWTRRSPQKSLIVNMNKGENNDTVYYPVWGINKNQDSDEQLQKFVRFRLRQGGNDSVQAGFSDALSESLFAESNSESAYYAPVMLYLNGDFWGVYMIREQYTDRFFEHHYDVDKDNVLELTFPSGCNGFPTIAEGPFTSYNDAVMKTTYWPMYEFARKNTTFTDELLEEFETKYMNVDSLIDNVLCSTFSGNADWPGNNNRMWRAIEPDKDAHSRADGRWNYCLQDNDWAFSGGYNGDNNGFSRNMITQMMSAGVTTWGTAFNAAWSTLYFRRCMTNENFRLRFLNRLVYFYNYFVDIQRFNDFVDTFVDQLSTTRDLQMSRWKNTRALAGGDVHSNLDNASWEVAYKTFNTRFRDMVMNYAVDFYSKDSTMASNIEVQGPKLNVNNYYYDGGVFANDRNIVISAVNPNLALVDLKLNTSDIQNSQSTTLSWDLASVGGKKSNYAQSIDDWYADNSQRNLKVFNNTYLTLNNEASNFSFYRIKIGSNPADIVSQRNYQLFIQDASEVTIETVYSN